MKGAAVMLVFLLACADSGSGVTYECDSSLDCPTDAEVWSVQDDVFGCCPGSSSGAYYSVEVRRERATVANCQIVPGRKILVFGVLKDGTPRSRDSILACVRHEACHGYGCGSHGSSVWEQCGCG